MTFGSSPSKRIRGRPLSRIRQRHFSKNPLCVHCLAKSPPVIRVATQLDHIVALVNGGEDNDANRQLLCDECHSLKTAKDLGYKPRERIGFDGYPAER